MSLSIQFDLLAKTRKNLWLNIKDCSLEQLNLIPKGFNNNLIWNFAHCAVTQELLVYGLSGNPMTLDNEIIYAYRKGTKPTGKVDMEFVEKIKQHLISSIDQMDQDYNNNLFNSFKSYPTSYGVTLNTIEEAITFNNLHEAMHLGTMIAMRKFV